MHTPANVGLDPLRFLQALWKQKAWWALLWLLATAAVLAAVWLIPPRYKVEAMLALEFAPPARRPAGSLAHAEIRSRLELAKLRVLRRERLSELLRQADPKLAANGKSRARPQIEQFRTGVRVVTLPEVRSGPFSAVRVSFEGPNAQRSAVLVNSFAAALAREFEQGAAPAVEAKQPEARVAAAWSRLAECHDALKAFEAEHGPDPEQRRQSLIAEQEALRSEIAALDRSLARAAQERSRLEQAAAEADGDWLRPPAAMPAPATAPESIRRLRERLASLQARYKDDHPDVRTLRAELARLEVLQAPGVAEGDGELSAQPSGPDQTQIKLERLRAELAQAERKQEELAGRRQQLAERLEDLAEQIRQTSWLARRYRALMREYELAEAGYRLAVVARQQAESEAERRPPPLGARLVLLEQATVPDQPAFPNRRLLGLIGALGALVPCAAAAVFRELGSGPLLAVFGLTAPGHNGSHAVPRRPADIEPPANGRRAAHAG